MRKKEILKKIAAILLRVIISVILLFVLFRQVDEKKMYELISHADKPHLFLALITFSLIYLLGIFRWEVLLKAAKIHLSLKRIIMSFSGGIFFSLFLPSTIGGDFVRSVDLAAHTNKPKEIVATVLLDRLSGYIGMVLMALLALAAGYKLVADSAVFLGVGIITGLLIFILLVLFNKAIYVRINKLLQSPNAGRIREIIKNLHQEIHYFRHRKEAIADSLLLSFVIQLINAVSFYFIALSLGINISIIHFLVFLPIISAITLLPVSIGGLGLRDASVIYFFAKAGLSKDPAFAMSLINFSFILLHGIIGGLVYILTVRHRRPPQHKAAHTV